MKVRFWGTRGSIARAGPATVGYGGNTSCVEVRSEAGTLAVLDCGTGIHELGHALTAEFPHGPINGHLLITHTHWDHIQGFPLFPPLFREGSKWHVYGPRGVGASLRETLSVQMHYSYFPVNVDQLVAEVEYHDLVEGEFGIGDMRVIAHYLNHPALTLGYRIEADRASVVYASDHEPYDRDLAKGGAPGESDEDAAHVAFLAGADLVIHDAQYRAEEYPEKVGWGHSTIEYAVDCAIAARASQLALHHHDPLRDDPAVEENVRRARARVERAGSALDVFAATEGDERQITGSGGANVRARESTRDATMVPRAGPGSSLVLAAGCDAEAMRCIREAAEADGFRLFEAVNLAGASEAVSRERPAVIFCGSALQGGDALELSGFVRSLPAPYGASAVIISIRGELTDRERKAGRSAGITDWLVGAVTPQYLRTRLRAWILRQSARWQAAALPEDEEDRLDALASTNLLDTNPERRFDQYTDLVSQELDVPIALISLVDAERQWFKSRHGLTVEETPRDRAFCAHAILQTDILEVSDAFKDDRFADNPLVTGEPHVRFYAGVPLEAPGGRRVGTLCVMAHEPRTLDPAQRKLLGDIARLVEVEIARSLRRA